MSYFLKAGIIGGAIFLAASSAKASSTLVQLDLTYVATDVQFSCLVGSCPGLQVFSIGDTVEMTYKFKQDNGSATLAPVFVGPVGITNSADGSSGSFFPTSQFALNDFSDPFLPSGIFDVIGWNNIGFTDHGDGTSSESDAGFVIYGASDWFETNAGPFDPATFLSGLLGGLGDWNGTEYFGSTTESIERAVFDLTVVGVTTAAVPLPATGLMMLGGLVGLSLSGCSKRRSKA